MQISNLTEKQKEKEEAMHDEEEEGVASTSMSVDIPPSYDDAISNSGMSPSVERALPPMPSTMTERVLPHKLHWKLNHLRKCQIQLGLFDCSHSSMPQATVRMPLEHLSGVSLNGISNDINTKLKHIKRCSLNLGIPVSASTTIPSIKCHLTHVANCNIDMAGSPLNLFGPIHGGGGVNVSHTRRTTIVRALNPSTTTTTATAIRPIQPYNATSYFEANKLSRCTIDLRANGDDPPLTKVILSHLSHCVVYLDRVNGPVTLNQCKRCIVVIPGQQALFRKCSRILNHTLREDQMHVDIATTCIAMPALPPQYHELFPHDETLNSNTSRTSGIPMATHVKFSTRVNDQADQWLGRAINAETWKDTCVQGKARGSSSVSSSSSSSSSSSCSVSSLSSIGSHSDRKYEKRAIREERKQAKHTQKLIRKAEKYERKMQKLAMKLS
ncbi:hypothetical protein BDF22DRAFT_739223 [Syncephalis plumigaleata]|nr:hypothetical protein BDF22DRAFT_739223 [Syncephalis plumigaleata]